jgi:hypothetical protein
VAEIACPHCQARVWESGRGLWANQRRYRLLELDSARLHRCPALDGRGLRETSLPRTQPSSAHPPDCVCERHFAEVLAPEPRAKPTAPFRPKPAPKPTFITTEL